MRLRINGAESQVDDGWSLADLVRARVEQRRQVAVARNGEVVPRTEWDSTRLTDGDLIEILAATAGG